MKVLVACEESQSVCTEFRKKGHEAYSCDIIDQSGGHPEWHIMADVLPLLNGDCKFVTMDGVEHEIVGEWDMIIAFPPCKYLSNDGARFLYSKGILNEEILKKGIVAKDFFMRFYYAKCKRIAIENPFPLDIYCMPIYTQIIQPYEFGHPLRKKICLWLKGLPELKPTNILPERQRQSTKILGKFNKGANSVKTFTGISKAMAEQWGKNK